MQAAKPIKPLRPETNYICRKIFKYIFFSENLRILIPILLNSPLCGPIFIKAALI